MEWGKANRYAALQGREEGVKILSKSALRNVERSQTSPLFAEQINGLVSRDLRHEAVKKDAVLSEKGIKTIISKL